MQTSATYWNECYMVTLCLSCSSLIQTSALFQENGLSFSLEAVKRLQELTEISGVSGQQNPRLKASTISLCADPMLPQEFLPLCKQRGASASLARLGETIKY